MADDIQVDQDKFDAVLKRMAEMKPMTAKEVSAKIKAEKASKAIQKMDKQEPHPNTALRGMGGLRLIGP